ncbi:L-dopachrome tautomerase-related protein [Altericista sp. CCNU0014]|uniref:L-dopachrome tautomerase-related protein n=1 Tax=Altericista sp. CCNU0014 TaxID=3082949 RepID=UPI00384D85EC
MKRSFASFCAIALLSLSSGLFLKGSMAGAAIGQPTPQLTEVARSPRLWNVVAVSAEGRIFASFPRWLGDATPSVGEVMPDGSVRAFPGDDWNQWTPGASSQRRFVNVNSVQVDAQNNLWVVDSASPRFGQPVIPGGPKLVQIDLVTNQVKRVYNFSPEIAPARSTLNDVQVRDGYAYLTESGLGAIIVVDLKSGQARRVLANHPSTKSDPTIVPVVEGRELRDADGRVPQTHANAIALSPDGTWLYFQPTYGPNLLRVRTADLRNTRLSETDLGQRVERLGKTVASGGMTVDRRGILYLADIEKNAIAMRCPNGQLKPLVQDSRLTWPDGGSMGRDGNLYFPVAQVHRLPRFSGGVDRTEKPFRLFKVNTQSVQC